MHGIWSASTGILSWWMQLLKFFFKISTCEKKKNASKQLKLSVSGQKHAAKHLSCLKCLIERCKHATFFLFCWVSNEENYFLTILSNAKLYFEILFESIRIRPLICPSQPTLTVHYSDFLISAFNARMTGWLVMDLIWHLK